MKKLWLKYKEELIPNTIIFLFFLGAGMLFFFLYANVWHDGYITDYCDASLIVFAVLASFSLLVLLTRWGTYDTMGYGFHTMGHYIFNNKKNRKYEDLIDYKEKKQASRNVKGHYYLPLFMVAFIFLILLIVFEIIYQTY